MKKVVLGIGAAAMLLVAACSGPAEPAAPVTVPGPTVTATATATTTVTAVAADNTYSTPAEIRDRMKAVGMVCDDWSTTADVAGSCQSGAVLISAFPETEQGDELYQSALTLAFTTLRNQPDSGYALIVGPNWFVRMPDDTNFGMFQDALDGIKLR